jgi:proline dehydrogenase
MSVLRSFVLRTAGAAPVERTIRRSRLFRPVVSRFIAGDTLDEALPAAQELLVNGLMVSLDYLGENTKSEEEARAACATYVEMLDRIAELPEVRAPRDWPKEPLNISIKLTQCGIDQGFDFAEANFRSVLEAAARHGNFVRVDMEASDYTERTLEMIERVYPDFANTGTVLQSYLYRTVEDVERVIRLGARVRLVKGAYLEPPDVAYPEKHRVDEAFVAQAKRLLEAADYPAIATHDEAIIQTLNAFVAEREIPKERFEYQMLHGIRRDLQESLCRAGYNVRVYVPFGDQWYPYFSRRLAERPANMMFILKAMAGR